MTPSAIPARALEIRLARQLVEREPSAGHYDVVEVPVNEPGPGEVLVRTDYLGFAATDQDLMRPDSALPVPPFRVGERISGRMVGTVVASASPELAVGDLVMGRTGWCEYHTGAADGFVRLDRAAFPSPAYYLSQGPTAHYGMTEIARVGEGDVVYVSGAAGGVGSLAGQIARLRGAARVIGSAGSKAKVDYLVNELGYDAAFDYHDGPIVDRLRELAPDGLSVFFDNVGGEHFEAAVQAAAPRARFALCGALSDQIGRTGGSPRLELMTAIVKHLEILPFALWYARDHGQVWLKDFTRWTAEGRFVFPHTTVEGDLRAAPGMVLSLLHGEYRGNVTLRLAGPAH